MGKNLNPCLMHPFHNKKFWLYTYLGQQPKWSTHNGECPITWWSACGSQVDASNAKTLCINNVHPYIAFQGSTHHMH